MRVLIFGSSGSGKSMPAGQLAGEGGLTQRYFYERFEGGKRMYTDNVRRSLPRPVCALAKCSTGRA
jgi:hypothetical protein